MSAARKTTKVALLAVIGVSVAGLVFAGTVIARSALAPGEPLALQRSTIADPANPDVWQVAGRPHDGDTFRVAIGLTARDGDRPAHPPLSHSVRLLGIDTPEIPPAASPAQCMGEEAAGTARGLLEGKQVTLTTDPAQGDADRYGRWLRYAQTDDIPDIGGYLVHEGYARVYEQYPVARTAQYRALQTDAKTHLRGGWAPAPQGCGW